MTVRAVGKKAETTSKQPEKITMHQWLRKWARFYREVFGLTLNTKAVKLPQNHQEGFNALLVVAWGVTLTMAWEATQRLMGKTWHWWDANASIEDAHPAKKQARSSTTHSYAVWHQGGREADTETRNLSTEQCEAQGLQGITLLERLIFGIFHWWERQEHLDTESVTLCGGSRDSSGNVPSVRWGAAHGVDVRGYRPTSASSYYGVRVVVL